MKMDIVDMTLEGPDHPDRVATRDQRDADAAQARYLVTQALNRTGDIYRNIGATDLLTAALVYATLATR